MIKRRLVKLEKNLAEVNIQGIVPHWDLPPNATDCLIIDLMGQIYDIDLLNDAGKKLARMAHLSWETPLPCYSSSSSSGLFKPSGPPLNITEERKLEYRLAYVKSLSSIELRPYVKNFDTLQADLMECYRKECEESDVGA